MKFQEPLKPVCLVHIFPHGDLVLHLPHKPGRWKRFWMWVFFGWTVEDIK